jgi:hypothetical protein
MTGKAIIRANIRILSLCLPPLNKYQSNATVQRNHYAPSGTYNGYFLAKKIPDAHATGIFDLEA